jgi:hypothetical protein
VHILDQIPLGDENPEDERVYGKEEGKEEDAENLAHGQQRMRTRTRLNPLFHLRMIKAARYYQQT